MRKLFIRADASISIGTGHVMRMIALAQAWRDEGGDVVFLCAEIASPLEQRLASEGFYLLRIHAVPGSREDLELMIQLIADVPKADRKATCVVLDGYHFGADYQLGIKAEDFRLLVVDDYGHADFYHADWVINQNISARESFYTRCHSETQLFLGPKFAMLRKEFLAYKDWRREIVPVAKSVLVTLGGSDPENVTLQVIKALGDMDLHVKVVIGGSNPHLKEIKKFVQTKNNGRALIEIVSNATNMPELMVWADIAVAAGGSTAWELAFLGLPNLLFILADNQIQIARELGEVGFAECLGRGTDFSKQQFFREIEALVHAPSRRMQSSLVGRNMVDGLGSSRLVQVLTNLR